MTTVTDRGTGIERGSAAQSPVAEQAAAAAAASAGSAQDVLLATKLHVPARQPGFVPRPRLADRLELGLSQKLTLVSAPAGSGKTALLADWARQNRRPVAWLTLDPGDNDPARFWRHAAAALDQLRPGIAEQVAPLIGSPAPQSFDGVVTALINAIAAQPADGEIVLLLDDYNPIGSQRVHESLAFLIDHLPPGLRLMMTRRADPPLGLARLRANAQLAELRVTDLRFTAEEAGALLRLAAGEDLPDTAIAALTARIGGWAAGLQLAGLSLRGRSDIPEFAAAFDDAGQTPGPADAQRRIVRVLLRRYRGQARDRHPGRGRHERRRRHGDPLARAGTGPASGQRQPRTRPGRSAPVDDVAEAVVFALSSTFLTGVTLPIDGGPPLT